VEDRAPPKLRRHREDTMHFLIDHAVEPFAPTSPTPPVNDLLRVYLGQSSGSRSPESDGRRTATAAQELWDHLGDFA
jgi:hypothetical protein